VNQLKIIGELELQISTTIDNCGKKISFQKLMKSIKDILE
jgi:hypothetical protein